MTNDVRRFHQTLLPAHDPHFIVSLNEASICENAIMQLSFLQGRLLSTAGTDPHSDCTPSEAATGTRLLFEAVTQGALADDLFLNLPRGLPTDYFGALIAYKEAQSLPVRLVEHP
jgi:hypothetical protein